MAARRIVPVRPVEALAQVSVDDPTTSRALDTLGSAVTKLQRTATSQVIEADLAVGANVVQHALDRVPRFVSVMPTAAGVDWYVTERTARQISIVVVGAAMPAAAVKVE